MKKIQSFSIFILACSIQMCMTMEKNNEKNEEREALKKRLHYRIARDKAKTERKTYEKNKTKDVIGRGGQKRFKNRALSS